MVTPPAASTSSTARPQRSYRVSTVDPSGSSLAINRPSRSTRCHRSSDRPHRSSAARRRALGDRCRARERVGTHGQRLTGRRGPHGGGPDGVVIRRHAAPAASTVSVRRDIASWVNRQVEPSGSSTRARFPRSSSCRVTARPSGSMVRRSSAVRAVLDLGGAERVDAGAEPSRSRVLEAVRRAVGVDALGQQAGTPGRRRTG